jgi:hypothetical protein
LNTESHPVHDFFRLGLSEKIRIKSFIPFPLITQTSHCLDPPVGPGQVEPEKNSYRIDPGTNPGLPDGLEPEHPVIEPGVGRRHLDDSVRMSKEIEGAKNRSMEKAGEDPLRADARTYGEPVELADFPASCPYCPDLLPVIFFGQKLRGRIHSDRDGADRLMVRSYGNQGDPVRVGTKNTGTGVTSPFISLLNETLGLFTPPVGIGDTDPTQIPLNFGLG